MNAPVMRRFGRRNDTSHGGKWQCFSVTVKLRRHTVQSEVVLRGNAKRIGHAVEEGEQRDNVDGLRNLIFGPAHIAELLYILVRGARSSLGNQLGVAHQRAV